MKIDKEVVQSTSDEKSLTSSVAGKATQELLTPTVQVTTPVPPINLTESHEVEQFKL